MGQSKISLVKYQRPSSRMKASSSPPKLPMLTLGGDATIHFNNDVILLLPVPGGHTAGDVVVHFTQSRVACIGDLIRDGLEAAVESW